jgi:hypothetical protein
MASLRDGTTQKCRKHFNVRRFLFHTITQLCDVLEM